MEYVDRLIARNQHESAMKEEWRKKIRDCLPSIVSILANDFGAKKIILFGSTVHGKLSDEPDIDILVEGLLPEKIAEASGRLFMIAPFPVDLVPAESGRSDIAGRALEQGEILHVA